MAASKLVFLTQWRVVAMAKRLGLLSPHGCKRHSRSRFILAAALRQQLWG